MSRRALDEKHAGLYLSGCFIAIGVFWSLPLFLARIDPSPAPAPKPAQAVVKLPKVTAPGGTLVFNDVASQSREFIGYYHSITLTPEHEEIKKAVLGAMPAACCSGSTAYTCCCPCNLSKTIWGLSNYALSQRGADAQQLRGAVDTWIAFVNPDGYKGNACYVGGCDGGMSAGGCGTMQEATLTV